MDKEPKRFSEWVEVDCNQCERWWLNQCDGCKDTLKGSKMPCNSFLATRQVKIPQEINELKKAIKGLKTAIAILSGIIAAILVEIIIIM